MRRLLSTEGVRDAGVLAIVTVLGGVTTVGYGDSYPRTDSGRVIGFVAILTAAAAERFMRAQRAEEHELHEQLGEIGSRLTALERRHDPSP